MPQHTDDRPRPIPKSDLNDQRGTFTKAPCPGTNYVDSLHKAATPPFASLFTAHVRSRLVGTLAHALRHRPEKYGIQLDEHGWADLATLLINLNMLDVHWAWLTERDLVRLLQTEADERFECRNGQIRALYGHSVKGVRAAVRRLPPPDLYHATDANILSNVLTDSLEPMNRCYVHLTSDPAYASCVGASKSQDWVLLAVTTAEAVRNGHEFYQANSHVWQTSSIPPHLLQVLEQD